MLGSNLNQYQLTADNLLWKCYKNVVDVAPLFFKLLTSLFGLMKNISYLKKIIFKYFVTFLKILQKKKISITNFLIITHLLNTNIMKKENFRLKKSWLGTGGGGGWHWPLMVVVGHRRLRTLVGVVIVTEPKICFLEGWISYVLSPYILRRLVLIITIQYAIQVLSLILFYNSIVFNLLVYLDFQIKLLLFFRR